MKLIKNSIMNELFPKMKTKAGRFIYDNVSKKVKVSKEKGFLSLYTNEEQENHVSWINLQTNLEEIDIIVFPFDAQFEQVTGQNNTYVLRFQSNQDRYFFYLQEKINSEEFVRQVNQRIVFTPPEEMEVEEPQKQEMQQQQPPKKSQLKGISPDFIARLTSNLMAAQKKGEGDISHLSTILTPEVISNLLGELDEKDKEALVQFLPEEQKGVEHIASNIRSPQFQQAADVLSDALNSENVLPLFMEMGLDQNHLKKHYGVHAFLVALQEKCKKFAEEKKE